MRKKKIKILHVAQAAGGVDRYIRIEAFSDSPYKLRIVLLERHQRASEYDWLIELKRKMPNEARLEFEAGTYSKPVLTIGPLDEKDEASYIENYLEAYLPLLGTSAFIDECKADKANKAKIIQSKFRNSMSAPCLRPLFLSVFIEVWLSKEGRTNLTSTEELLSEYLNKEKKRWKLILGDDILVDSYLRVLSVACIVGIFNITDVQGTNYLAEDCNRLISFFDARSGRPGADNLFEDLFVSVSEQEDDPAQPTLFELLYQQMDKEPQKAESGGSSKSLDQDEKFSLLAPCIFGRRLLLRVKPYIHRRRNISEFLIKLLIRQSNGLNSIHPPHHTHPEERIWAGRTPRVPDAPRIKHDKMKQFYMVDMRRKRW